MSSSECYDELLQACAAGNAGQVRVLHQRYSGGGEAAPFDAMMLRAAENGHVDVIRYCLEQGAEMSWDVIIEATGCPEVFKILVTVGGLDVNEDFGLGGDMLSNAVWEGKVS